MTDFRTILIATVPSLLAADIALAELSGECEGLLAGERLTIAVPNSAGGGYDTYARALAPVLAKHGNLTARVTNMPGGGGLAARGFVMNSDTETLALLIENTADLVTAPMGNVGRGELAEKQFMIEGFTIVGVLHNEPSAWFGRPDLDIFNPGIDRLVGAEGSIEEALLNVYVAGVALGYDVDTVTGYDGTNEMGAAVLRGEADFSGASLTTSRRLAQDEGISVILALSDGPVSDDPDLPYLAGEGSVTWQLTEDLPEDEKTYRRTVAEAVAGLRSTARGMFVSANLSDDRTACMSALMDLASADPEFVETAEAQGRPVDPMMAAEASGFVARLTQRHLSILPVLQEIAAVALNE